MWKKIESRILVDSKRGRIVEDIIELHNGKRTDYLRFESPRCGVCAIMFNEEGKIFVAKEYNYPVDEWLYQFSGGGVGSGEELEAGLQRELREETGFRCESLVKIGWFYPTNRKSNLKMHVFVGSGLVEDPLPMDETEKFENFWMSEDEIDELVASGGIVNGGMLAAWSMYKARKGLA
jgi:ADP-ribose pyrophosphatase